MNNHKMKSTISDLHIVSFNCRSLSSSLLEIQELCKSHDVILLQETWLAKQQLHSLSSIHDDFLFVGTSCMDLEDGVMTGRPHGDTAVLWRKSLTAYPVSNVDKSIVGINIKCQNNSIIIINVYLPFNSPSNVEAYLKYLGALQILCEAQQSSNLCMVGDFNANKESTCGQLFNNFCKEQGYIISDRSILPSNTFIYLSDSHHATSWLDHCIPSSSVHKSIKNISVLYDYITSDHGPLSITFCCNLLPLLPSSDEATNQYTKSWSCASPEQKKRYNMISSELLKDVSFPAAAMQCRNATCDDHSHLNRRRRRLKGIHSRSDTNRTGAEGLSFYYPRLLYCLDQMLAVMSLSQHQVSSSKIVRPHAPCGARCIGMLLVHGLQFAQRRHTRNSVKERDPICACTNGIAQHQPAGV